MTMIISSARFGAAVGVTRDSVLAATRSPVSNVFIERISATEYRLYQKTHRGRYWKCIIDQPDGATLPGGKTPAAFRMYRQYSSIPYLKTENTVSANVVHTGTWGSITGSTYSGNSSQRSDIAGDYVTFTTPQACTLLGVVNPMLAAGGLAKVEIDNDATLANLLPTAQEVVDAGTFPNTILVANGGTLNPTDRVFDNYNASTINFQERLWADDLPETVHTLKVTTTGYKRAASTGIRYYSDAYLIGGPSITPTTTNVLLWDQVRLRLNRAEYEFAYRMNSGGVLEWAGGFAHGYEQLQGSLAITVDGTPTTMTDAQRLGGSSIVLSQSTNLFHPNVGGGSTVTCSVLVTHTLDQDGLQVDHTDTWQVSLNSDTTYPAMMSVESGVGGTNGVGGVSSSWTKGGGDAISTNVDLTQGNGVFDTVGQSTIIWQWEAGANGHWAAIMSAELPASTMLANYAYHDSNANFIWDKDANTKKAYMTRQGEAQATKEAISNGTVWQSSVIYRFAYLDDPNNVLSKS